LSKVDDAAALARRKAQDLLGRAKEKDREQLASRDKARQIDALKTAGLRKLRLAKEAKEAAEKAEKDATPRARAVRRSAPN
jgi:hypothetical protein